MCCSTKKKKKRTWKRILEVRFCTVRYEAKDKNGLTKPENLRWHKAEHRLNKFFTVVDLNSYEMEVLIQEK